MSRPYFDNDGYHIQFNVLDTAILRDAQKHPENYRDLVVRVAGFSAFFTKLAPGVQDEIIARTSRFRPELTLNLSVRRDVGHIALGFRCGQICARDLESEESCAGSRQATGPHLQQTRHDRRSGEATNKKEN